MYLVTSSALGQNVLRSKYTTSSLAPNIPLGPQVTLLVTATQVTRGHQGMHCIIQCAKSDMEHFEQICSIVSLTNKNSEKEIKIKKQ